MAGGVTLQVRQIGSYAAAGAAGPGDLFLMQPGGLGNPYASIDAATLVASALYSGPAMGIGVAAPPGTVEQVFSGGYAMPLGGPLFWNCYAMPVGEGDAGVVSWFGGISALQSVGQQGWIWQLGSGVAGGNAGLSTQMTLSTAGALNLPFGTLSVARGPGSANEVATAGWVGANTVASFNGRNGVVQLTSSDIYAALCLDSPLVTQNWVNGQIQSSIQLLLANHPFVFGWNGRTGAVYLTLADISCVFFQPGQQPITQTPPLTSNDYSIPNTAWVVEYIANEFAGGGGNLATQSWVLANTVNSFNGRQGVVTLTLADVEGVGGAPLNSPAFSGIPTAPTAAVGQATGQIATTAFVQQAITNNTAGVSTWNTRTGDVVLEAADVSAVGGLVNPSPSLLGNPTAPTQAPGTNLPLVANCEFVQAAIAAGTVQSFNTRTGAVTLTLADVTGVGGAPLVSPAFSSVPTAPTAAPGTNTVQLATCAFVTAALNAAGGVSSFNGRTGAVDLIANDISGAGGLVNPSVGLTGAPTATTATAGDNSQRIATTAFVATALSSGAVSSFNTRTGAVTLQAADLTAAGGALLASPAFTGAPTAPTAAAGTNNTQIATTAYVTAAILADTTGVTSFNTRTGAVSLILADITGAGGAPIASPSFTGTPLGPTATAGTSTTQLATTAFVQAAIASSGVSSFNARTGAVTLIANDISAAGGALLAGPTFTGVPAAPTAAPGTNTTQLATTAFVAAALGTYLPLTGGTVTGATSFTAAGTLAAPALTVSTAAPAGILRVGPAYLNASGNALQISGQSGGSPANLTTLSLNATTTSANAISCGTISCSTITTNGATITSGPINTGGASINCGAIGSTANIQGLNFVSTGTGVLYSGVSPPGANNMGFSWNSGLSLINAFVDGGFVGGLTPSPSDPRLKSNIAPPTVDALNVINQLTLQQFDLRRLGPGATPQHWDVGFMSDQLAEVIPISVSPGDGVDTYDMVNLLPVVAMLVGAVQQLSARVAALDGKPL